MTGENFVSISGGNVQGFIQENHGTVTQYFISQVSELISEHAPGTEELTQTQYRQKQVLLNKVKEYWIEGVLEKSLHTQAMIELGLEKRLDAVERPFIGFSERIEASRPILPTGTDATDVFSQMGDGRTLLILGEPGAGKTTTLLRLAQTMIARAEGGLSRLIPVVLNLSSWGSKRQSIENWLIEELYTKYKVSKTLGKSWLADQRLLLLLDGLDEVKANLREACVEAINQFTQMYGQTELVVCSRVADYEVLSNRLQLRGAIYIRALTAQQINHYLDTAGELGAVKTLLREDTVLQELAKSPLMLSVMALTYQGSKVEELRQTGSVEACRAYLFDAYIERMFSQEKIGKPRNYQPPYQQRQAKLWLTWLARRMVQTSQAVFFIEKMQPTGLPTIVQARLYRLGTSLMGALIGLLMGTIVQQPVVGLIMGGFGVLLPLVWWKIDPIKSAWRMDEIETVETLKWSWQEARKFSITGLLSGLPLAAITGLLFQNSALVVPYWLISVLILGVLGGLRGPEIETKTFPNQGIWYSFRSARILGTLGAALGFLIVIGVPNWWGLGLMFGLMFGLIFGGGKACLQHFTLRIFFWINGCIPWNYARFLNYASERVFLQKVGGGYIFVHRMLLEHFARIS